MKKEEFKGWHGADTPAPRLWVSDGNANYLLHWTSVCHVTADQMFTEVTFSSESGFFILRSRESLKDLFEAIQAEKVRKIEPCGLLKVVFVEPKEKGGG